ncbi:LuxR C-terminal-related transcriptional regulator [Edaphovirga cremea]|uniref:LuxR C-terminal-related transcriptional regulator n=1 Tax=Edaphovirga cremea TaxID=2267246 RepID=UPI00398A3A9D
MRVLMVDECNYTCLGASYFLNDIKNIDMEHKLSIESAKPFLKEFCPDIILLNLSNYCHQVDECHVLKEFITASQRARLYIYIDLPYPITNQPIMLTERVFILNKNLLPAVLTQLRNTVPSNFPLYIPDIEHNLFTLQELAIISLWMNEVPNYRIAKKLAISGRTVYVHKRHITEKTAVRNRLEFCFLYNVLKYFLPVPVTNPSFSLLPF